VAEQQLPENQSCYDGGQAEDSGQKQAINEASLHFLNHSKFRTWERERGAKVLDQRSC
jgi:hypothetical protein